MFENFITFFRASAEVISDETQSQTDAANCEEDYLTVSLSSFLKSGSCLGKITLSILNFKALAPGWFSAKFQITQN